MDIKALNSKITDIRKSAKTYGIDFNSHGEGSSSSYDKQIELRRTYSHNQDTDIVGLQKDIEKLVKHLVSSEKHVAILGMGGLGKTTLAKKIYWDRVTRHHFDCFAWACVSQQCKPKDVLKALLIGLQSASKDESDRCGRMEINELTKQLYQLQEEKKCLVVLDDAWKPEDLQSIHAAFPPTTRSKIILTTRNKEVVSHIRTYMGQESVLHELQLLTEEESLDLFWRKARSRNSSTGLCDPNMEEIGRKIVLHCKGLPLAIVVLGGNLAQKKTIEDWEKVLEDIPFYLHGGNGHRAEDGEVMQVVAFSFWDLPYYLKPCFLYLGQFPEDSEINVESLVRKWVAEGFVSHNPRFKKTLVDVARSYVDELEGRCMIELKLTWHCQRKKTCRLHDIVREFCLSKLDEQEDFLKILHVHRGSSSTQNIATKVFRLAIYNNDVADIDIYKHNNLRSVSCFTIPDHGEWTEHLFRGLKMVRIVNMEGINLKLVKFPNSVGKLLHLRYLSIRGTDIDELPSSIGKLRCLQTLDLRAGYGYIMIPNVLWKMEQLIHLYLPHMMERNDPKILIQLDTLTKLETLINFDTRECDSNSLQKMGNLQKLTTELYRVEDVKMIVQSRSILKNQLQHTNLSVILESTEEEGQAIVSQLLACHQLHLRKLSLQLPLVKLPRCEAFPLDIVHLTLAGTQLKEDPMPTLEKLPQLSYLRLDSDSFVGKELVCSYAPGISGTITNVGVGFPRLKVLELFALVNVEVWKVEKGAMPNLQRLSIYKCKELKQLPEGLQYVTTLMVLIVSGDDLKRRVRMGGEDFYKVKHVPIIKGYYIPQEEGTP